MSNFLLVFTLAMGVAFVVALTRKGSVKTAKIGSRRNELHHSADPATVFAVLAAINDPKLRVDDKDASLNRLVLSSPISFTTWGFLYPVYLHASGTGTRIEVGCSSKVFQIGPLVTRAHNECCRAIENALSVPAARVA